MKTWLIGLALVLIAGGASAQPCTSTLSSGADIASAIGSASGGDVICLNTGTYGTAGVTEIAQSRPASRVTIRSTSGNYADVLISLKEIYRSCNLTFLNLRMYLPIMSDYGSTPKTCNMTFNGVKFTQAPMVFDSSGWTAANIKIINSIFADTGFVSSGVEGTLQFTCLSGACTGNAGVSIEYSLFDGTGICGDGVQTTAVGFGGLTIGPGNIFRNWKQSDSSCPGSSPPHVDAHQIVGSENIKVIGNYFVDNSVHIGYYDGGSNITLANNVFVNGGGFGGNGQSFQIGGIVGMLMDHNTIKDGQSLSIGTKSGFEPNSGWTLTNNLVLNSNFSTAASFQQEGCGSGCSGHHNMLADGSSTVAEIPNTSPVTGTPVFVGGTPPFTPSTPQSTWSGWRLTSGSPGKAAGSDGGDVGTRYTNPTAPASFTGN